ncbi:GNAT family N-acetyltransferase [Chryseolinea sp. T2]|uniref:GNAT family N-acetyltransferase n=1 Tax=Chryseolinea sp. T2 TaxID=3129255 RepID=UPI003077C697
MTVSRCELFEIQSMRALFLNELNAQFIHDKCHLYGWSDDYFFAINGEKVGYGCVWGINERKDRDTIFEYYLLPEYRRHDTFFMRELIRSSGATTLECQTNDPNTSRLFFENAVNISVESIVYQDANKTDWSLEDLKVVDCSEATDSMREHKLELQKQGVIVASGGLMLNYNPPYADVYMDVPEAHRRNGYGTMVVQELKKMAYEIGRTPVARCRVSNLISKATLVRAGFQPCGYWLTGKGLTNVTVR